MTAAEVERLHKFLEARQSIGGDDYNEGWHEQTKVLFSSPVFHDLTYNTLVTMAARPCLEVLANSLALMFELGQRWERSEQMRREFGDAEVPR